MQPRFLTAVFLSLVCVSGLQKTHAQDFDVVDQFRNIISAVESGIDDLMQSKTLKGTRMKLGFAIGSTPDYPGSDIYSFRALPMITIDYKDLIHFENGHLNVTAFKKGNWSAGGIASLNFGREERQNEILTGLGNVGDTVDLGIFTKYNNRKTGTLMTLNMRHGLGSGQALRADVTLGQVFYHKEQWTLLAGLRAKYFDRQTMQTNFGITAAQASQSEYDLPIFRAKAGVSEAMAALVAVHKPKESRVQLISVFGYGRLFGSAGNSPISGGQYGSNNQMVLGTAITYSF